jgi:hypothetical protein
MEGAFPHRTNKQDSGTGPGGGTGEARRLRISEFHQNTRRAPSFYARSNPPSTASTSQEADWREPHQEPLRRPPEEKKAQFPWFVVLAIVLIAAGLGGSLAGYFVGTYRGRNAATRDMEDRARTMTRLPADDAAALDQAVADIRKGDAHRALGKIELLRQRFPRTSSLSYLAALAALQSGQPIAAESLVKESMQSGQRISDSLALLAMLEKGKQDLTGERKARTEELLRASITADSANSSPHFELAMVLRDSNRRDEARQELLAAQSRLNPIDSHAVIETTLELMNLEDTSNDSLPNPSATPRTITGSLSSAYISMRQGNFANASAALQSGKAMTTPDVFYYLISDPAFAPTSTRRRSPPSGAETN